MDQNNMPNKSPRLESLDVLRGLDLFMLVFLQPVLVSLDAAVDWSWLHAVMYQLDHASWEGLRVWDIVMPLFLFMTGASMPYSFAKYSELSSRRAAYVKVLRRTVILFLLGMVVQGHLLDLDPSRLCPYNNTLQAIAVGYLIASVFMLHLSLRGRLWATAALLIVYWLPMWLCGDYTPEGNFAQLVDRAIIGTHTDDLTYTWIWSGLNFGVTVMLGTFAGTIIRRGGKNALRNLIAGGTALIAAGLLWSVEMPVIKRIWSSSMVLVTGGVCFWLMALSYWWIDCRRHRRGLMWLKIYGMNAITAYVLGETISFRSIVDSLCHGLEAYIPQYYSVALTAGNYLILFAILWLMYRRRIFVKI